MRLNELVDNEGARKKRMRVGRGTSSGKGKTGEHHRGEGHRRLEDRVHLMTARAGVCR